jgi:hypothetical protein
MILHTLTGAFRHADETADTELFVYHHNALSINTNSLRLAHFDTFSALIADLYFVFALVLGYFNTGLFKVLLFKK